MYTIRQILGTTLGLTVSGVKHMSNVPTENSATNTTRSVDDLLKLARTKLEEAGKMTDEIVA